MLFNSLHFLYFFVTVFFLYFIVVPARYRWALLLFSSCYFYAVYIPKFIIILFFLITVDYFLGIQIYQAQGRKRKLLLLISIVANLGTLFFFKYFNFFNESVEQIAQLIHWNYSPVLLSFALPLGLSFHVFQSLSYVIEVYKGKQAPERHYGIYALYVMFFPQLVAGPIERPQHLLHQFHETHTFSFLNARRGLELMLVGFFKKLVLADWIAQVVDHVYIQADQAHGFTLFIAAILFSYQIYCDFSGYSDIAVGSALVLGYDLTNNFNRPFASRSIPEFWRRWHISLSNWLRDYLYYPLAFSGKRITKFKLYSSLIVTFTLIGLWHGAKWTYVMFGLTHGVLSAISLYGETVTKKVHLFFNSIILRKITGVLAVITTFLLVTASFIFFRSETVSQAIYILKTIGGAFLSPFESTSMLASVFSFESLGATHSRLLFIGATIFFLECIQYIQAKRGTFFIVEGMPRVLRWGWYYLIFFAILFFGHFEAQSFIYFQF
jgi:D-alanyl-lipoteichoic acid acyltransferase DltB (MBOAT superfamily)